MDFLKKHYEKVLLGVVLVGLAVAVAFLPFVISSEQAKLKEMSDAVLTPRPKPLTNLDLTVPEGMGGKETVRKLLEADPAVKAMVSSGYSDDPVMSDFRSYGFVGVLRKPYNAQELSEAVHTAITTHDPQLG